MRYSNFVTLKGSICHALFPTPFPPPKTIWKNWSAICAVCCLPVNWTSFLKSACFVSIDDGMANVRESAVRAAQDAARQAREAADVADRYAHDEPWRVAGAALAVGALLGFMLGRR
jgi:hypothetical protein